MEAVAKRDFSATSTEELSFKENQKMLILDLDDFDWYHAEIDGKEGLIPSSHIELKDTTWYFSKITRSDAVKLLIKKPEGAFLIRPSETIHGCFALSVKCSTGASVQHFRILRDMSGKFYIRNLKFDSLNELVDYHRLSPLQEVVLRDQFPKEFLVLAVYDFKPKEEDELEFRRGDMILVTDHSDEDWWHGKVGHRQGFFPAVYVTDYYS